MALRSFRDVYSEDNNFLIGDDFNTDRLRREARQLHLSKFKTTRREAHFARYRNSFLKCDLEQTNDRIEQERRLRTAEMERARAAVMKQAENRRKISQRRLSKNGAKEYSATTGKQVSTDLLGDADKTKDIDNGSRFVRRTGKGFRHSVTTLSLSRASSVTGNRDMAGENEPTTAMNSLEVRSSMSMDNDKSILNGSNIDGEPKPDEINNLGKEELDDGKEFENRSPPVSESNSGSGQNFAAESPSGKALNGTASLLNRRKSSSARNLQESNVKKTQSQSAHERWVWKEFDKIMKGFADFLQIEHKSVRTNMKNDAVVEKDPRTKPPQNITSLQTLSPLYFRYGVSDQIAFRF